MYRNVLLFSSAALVLTGSAGADPRGESDPRSGAEVPVSAEAIRAHMTFLSDDLLAGRETGTDGYRLAANYVAAYWETLGLKPAGDDDSYFQWLDFRRAVVEEETCGFRLQGAITEQLVYGQDYVMRSGLVSETDRVEAPLVFVGFGVVAQDMGYDDYAGVDVEGKIVVMMRGAPPTFPHNQRAYYSSGTLKSKHAVDRGAVGMVTFLTLEDAASRPWDRTVTNSTLPAMAWLTEDGQPADTFPQLRVSAFMSLDGAQKLFHGAGASWDAVHEAAKAGTPQGFDLAVSAELSRGSRHRQVRCANVAAVLPGSDPVLAREHVVFTGHLDHLGVGEEVDGDRIYNGAYDNASGIAVMLEMARVFAASEQRPRRSLLFLAVTGEEKGLLGSEYFCEYPTVPMDDIVGNVNLDMFLMLDPLTSLVAFGAEHSSLGGTVERAAGALGLKVKPDPMPAEVIFVRSDQYSFVRKGVPAVFLVSGGKEGGGNPFGTWFRDVYHTQKDDMSQYFDWTAAVLFTKANLLIAREIADASGRPAWNPGDFFGERFAGGGSSRRK